MSIDWQSIAVAPPSHATQVAYLAIVIAGVVSSVLAMIWVTWLVYAVRRDRRWFREGRCMRCGYDLRSSHEVCPECGEPVRK